MLFDHFDAVRIINLPHRTDRRAAMNGELRRLGVSNDPRVSYFDAAKFDSAGTFPSIGARGCYFSHLRILEEANAAGQDILILEDDVDFDPAARDFRLPDDWQIFYGGFYAANPDDLQNSDITGSHCIGFRAEVLPSLIQFLQQLLERPDHPQIDGGYVWFRRAYPDWRTVFSSPMLATQRPSRTDVADQKFFDRTPLLRDGAEMVRRMKRSASRASFGLREAILLSVTFVLVAALLVTFLL